MAEGNFGRDRGGGNLSKTGVKVPAGPWERSGMKSLKAEMNEQIWNRRRRRSA